MFKKSFLVLCLFIFTYPLAGQDMNKYKNIDWRIYHSLNWKDYVDYKSEEWQKMPFKEKNSLFQIPTEELQAMSTDELIEVSIDCYFARKIGKFSTIKSYYEENYDGFNGLRELSMREDIGKKIIDYYGGLQLQTGASSPAGLTMKKQIQILEYLIVHPRIIVKYKPDELDQLLSKLKEKYAEKTTMTAIYSEQDIVPNVYALARVLEKKDQQTSTRLHNVDKIDIFLGSGIFLTRETRDQILNICKGL